MKTVYLSLGSNIGNREAFLREAIARLASPKFNVVRISPVYETEPVEYVDQGWFLNLVLEAETTLFPLQLLLHTSRIENAMGRVRTVAKGPRKIDIDILLYGRAIIRAPQLEVPHPRMGERRFVLAPLADIAPEVRHPVTRQSIRQMLEQAPQQKMRKISASLAEAPDQ